MSNINEDLDLVRRVLSGDKESYSALVRKYKEKAYSLAYRLTRNHHDADELSQEAFIRAYGSLRDFKGKASFFTWFYRILVNLCINHINRRPKVVRQPVEELNIARSEPDAISVVANRELRSKIDAAVEKLPSRQKTAFTLRQMEGFSFKEVCSSMGCSLGAAKASYFQAVQKLRKYLKERGIKEQDIENID